MARTGIADPRPSPWRNGSTCYGTRSTVIRPWMNEWFSQMTPSVESGRRGHWEIENRRRRCKDVDAGEDTSLIHVG